MAVCPPFFFSRALTHASPCTESLREENEKMAKANRNYFDENERLKKEKQALEKKLERLENAECSCTAPKSKVKPAPSNQRTSDDRHARLRAGRRKVDTVDGTQAALADVSRREPRLMALLRQSTLSKPSTLRSGMIVRSETFLRRRLSTRLRKISTLSTSLCPGKPNPRRCSNSTPLASAARIRSLLARSESIHPSASIVSSPYVTMVPSHVDCDWLTREFDLCRATSARPFSRSSSTSSVAATASCSTSSPSRTTTCRLSSPATVWWTGRQSE